MGWMTSTTLLNLRMVCYMPKCRLPPLRYSWDIVASSKEVGFRANMASEGPSFPHISQAIGFKRSLSNETSSSYVISVIFGPQGTI